MFFCSTTWKLRGAIGLASARSPAAAGAAATVAEPITRQLANIVEPAQVTWGCPLKVEMSQRGSPPRTKASPLGVSTK